MQSSVPQSQQFPGNPTAMYLAVGIENAPEGSSVIEYSDGTFEILESVATPATHKLPGMIAFVWYLPSSFHARVRLPGMIREGMLVDCGAIDNLAGDQWVKRVESQGVSHGHGTVWKSIPALSVEGVGSRESQITQQAICPVKVSPGPPSAFTTNVVSNSELPGLLGLRSLFEDKALIDVFNKKLVYVGQGGYKIVLSPGSKTMNLENAASGHLLLPCTEWGEGMTTSSNSSKQVAF